MDDVFEGACQVTYRHMHDEVVIAVQYLLGGPENIQ